MTEASFHDLEDYPVLNCPLNLINSCHCRLWLARIWRGNLQQRNSSRRRRRPSCIPVDPGMDIAQTTNQEPVISTVEDLVLVPDLPIPTSEDSQPFSGSKQLPNFLPK